MKGLKQRLEDRYRESREGMDDRQERLLESLVFLSRFLLLAAPFYLLLEVGPELGFLREFFAAAVEVPVEGDCRGSRGDSGGEHGQDIVHGVRRCRSRGGLRADAHVPVAVGSDRGGVRGVAGVAPASKPSSQVFPGRKAVNLYAAGPVVSNMADSEGGDAELPLREVVDDLLERVDTLEDKVMMERLEDLSLEDQVETFEAILDVDEREVKRRMEMLDELEEEYKKLKVDDKLRYLYNHLKKLEEEQEAMTGGDRLQELRERIDELEERVGEGGEEDLDDVYDKLYTLRDRVQELQDGGVDTESVVEQVKEEVAAEMEEAGGEPVDKDEIVAEVRAELEDEIQGSEGEPGIDLDEIVERVREDLKGELGGMDEEQVQELEEETSEIEDRLDGLREQLRRVETEVPQEGVAAEVQQLREKVEELEEGYSADIPAEELLEALEYSGEELDDRFKEILVRVEQLSEDIRTQQERIDSLSQSQNMFESNMGELMERQKELNRKLKEEDRKLNRRTDMVLEALEEQVEISREKIEEELEREPGSVDNAVVEELRERARENREKLHELEERIKDLQGTSPVIVE